MMRNQGLDPWLVKAWLSARSIVRVLPSPVPEYGGFRVDTKSDAEVARWGFPKMVDDIGMLARSISEPRYFLKLCDSADELRATLPVTWKLHAPSYFMQAISEPSTRSLAVGYWTKVKQVGTVLEARIYSATGGLAASGFAAEAQGVFIYDRIVTELQHRRKGLGQALMRTLHDARQHPGETELLVATEEGRALYSTLGWKTISLYSTASIVTP